jgi:hypothetical protein
LKLEEVRAQLEDELTWRLDEIRFLHNQQSHISKEELLMQDLREQACWITLVFQSGLTTRILNDILVSWCYQQKSSLQAFFAAGSQEWTEICNLKPETVQKTAKTVRKVGTAQSALALSHI